MKKYYAEGMLFLKNGNIVKLGEAEFADPDCCFVSALPNGWAKLLTLDDIPRIDLALQEHCPTGLDTVTIECYMVLTGDNAVERYVGKDEKLKEVFSC